jgi:hypothetical protein
MQASVLCDKVLEKTDRQTALIKTSNLDLLPWPRGLEKTRKMGQAPPKDGVIRGKWGEAYVRARTFRQQRL